MVDSEADINPHKYVRDEEIAKLLGKPVVAIQATLIRHPEFSQKCSYRLWRMVGSDFLKNRDLIASEADAWLMPDGKVSPKAYALVRARQGTIGDDDGGGYRHVARAKRRRTGHTVGHGHV